MEGTLGNDPLQALEITAKDGLVKTKYDLICEKILELEVIVKQTAFEAKSQFDQAEDKTREHKEFILAQEKKLDAKISWAHGQQERYEQMLGEYKAFKQSIGLDFQKVLDRTGDKLRLFERSIEDV